ncbi:magnesium/cobalt transporter CorA [Tundrisphaera lichenicola]|uniref:magnesium/cobalt transporter CorA n=1 Tax=Tundrisphaera lichenicola TaxID=2029860 RepID=UPI003EBC4A63
MVAYARFPGRLLVALALLSIGCSEELGPEHPPSTSVRGMIRMGRSPVGGGWIQFIPNEGTRGNLRIARIQPDGSFRSDKVPVGRVVIGLDQIPVGSIPTTVGPASPRMFEAVRSPIRRNIPDRPEVELIFDLIEEATRAGLSKRTGRRRRRRSNGKSERDGFSGLLVEDRTPDTPPRPLPRIRVIYRDGEGSIHLDWPSSKIPEAVADEGGVLWVDIEDIESANNASVEALLRDVFRFHPLAIEDALQDCHVPRLDDWGDYLYLVTDTIDFDPETDDLRLHELDVFLGANYLLTYHNEAIEALERHRLNLVREPQNRLKHGADHLLYRFLDDIVAEFLPAINHLDDAIDDAQDEVFAVPTPKTLQKIFQVKRSALRIHRTVIPMREVLNRLARDPIGRIDPEHRVYFRDVFDHLVRIHDIVESLRDLIAGALDTYLSVVSNRTNDIMKALTLVNVMFLPMTFVAGFFGMNFFGDTLMFTRPGLPKSLIFWLACSVMLATPLGMGWLAWRRRWF